MNLEIEFEQETDGRWIAEVPALPGVMAYGASRELAGQRVAVLARRVQAQGFLPLPAGEGRGEG
jgi:hypothetical protein